MKDGLRAWAAAATSLGYEVQDGESSIRVKLRSGDAVRVSESDAGISAEVVGLVPRWVGMTFGVIVGFYLAYLVVHSAQTAAIFVPVFVYLGLGRQFALSAAETTKNQIYIVSLMERASKTPGVASSK